MLRATVYLDVICSHSWAVRESLLRLAEEFGTALHWEYKLYPLLQTPETFGDKWNNLATTREIGPHWAEVSEHLDAPIAHTLWRDNPIRSTVPAARAYLAALRQQHDSGASVTPSTSVWRFLDAMHTAALAQKRDAGARNVLLTLASQTGLDQERLARDLDDPAIAAEAEAVVSAAVAKGVRSRPTLILTGEAGQEYWVIGPRPHADYRDAVLAMLGGRVGPGTVMKIGGRIFGFDDLHAAGPGALRLGAGAGLPPEALTRLHDGLAALGDTHLVWLQGRVSGRAVSLVGVQATGRTPAEAERLADQGFALLGAPAAVLPAEVETFLAAQPPAVGLKWTPGPAGSGPGHLGQALPGDYLLHLVARPMPEGEREKLLGRLDRSARRLRTLQADPSQGAAWAPALADSLAMREGKRRRLEQGPVWWASPFLLGDGPLADSARAAFRDESALLPLRTVSVGDADRAHLDAHLRTFTQCRELELQGSYRWQSELTGGELREYIK